MKKIFFTSNTNHYHKVNGKKIANEIDNANGIVDQIKQLLNGHNTVLYIASSPDDIEKVEGYSKLIFEGFKLSGLEFSNYLILDNRTIERAAEYVVKADLIFLSGGDTFIQNEFFKKINLKSLVNDYNGVIIGQSAGSMNLAEKVYNSPEEGDNSKPLYFDGLGLSQINIEPHFELDTSQFNELENYERNHVLKESKTRPIYALCDGSHILETDEKIVAYGESYIIQDGIISLLCNDGEYKLINTSPVKRK